MQSRAEESKGKQGNATQSKAKSTVLTSMMAIATMMVNVTDCMILIMVALMA